jgi:hypothetical protein
LSLRRMGWSGVIPTSRETSHNFHSDMYRCPPPPPINSEV